MPEPIPFKRLSCHGNYQPVPNNPIQSIHPKIKQIMKKLLSAAFLAALLSFSNSAFSIPMLSSLPTAQYVIFLDFDGHFVQSTFWNSGNPINCAPSGLTDDQVTMVFNRVSEDFRPFEINITTDSTKYLAVPLIQRMRIIITPTSAWQPGVGGVSWTGSFTWGNETPAFVFVDKLPVGGPPNCKMIAEASSHESGHTLGLSHQSRFLPTDCNNPVEVYNSGNGTGEPSWAPIMGNSYSRNMTGWNDGPTQWGCLELQDNLSTITSQNGFTYRADDYAEVLNISATALNINNINTAGIISTSTDKDAFKAVLTGNSNFHLVATPYNVGAVMEGANLDIRLNLYNTAGVLLHAYDPATTMSVTVDTILNAGTYYVLLQGTGNANTSNYGSLGSYTLTGAAGALPIHSIVLSGNNANNKHNLNWNIIADEPIRSVGIEASENGINFNTINTVGGSSTKFSYQPYQNNTTYYRLKVTSVIDQTMYSNVIALRTAGNAGKPFEVSSLVNNDITVNAAENFKYKLNDANGRTLAIANGVKGINKININNQPNGFYTIQIISNNTIQSERIIKQ
jgi:hypothetical protein